MPLGVPDDKLRVHDFRHVRSLVMVRRDHFREDFEEFIIVNQTVLVHLLILLHEKLQIFQKSVLELDRLAYILITEYALTAVAEV